MRWSPVPFPIIPETTRETERLRFSEREREREVGETSTKRLVSESTRKIQLIKIYNEDRIRTILHTKSEPEERYLNLENKSSPPTPN